jgi:hypothetical protein
MYLASLLLLFLFTTLTTSQTINCDGAATCQIDCDNSDRDCVFDTLGMHSCTVDGDGIAHCE